jgi:ATP sulfurylase
MHHGHELVTRQTAEKSTKLFVKWHGLVGPSCNDRYLDAASLARD